MKSAALLLLALLLAYFGWHYAERSRKKQVRRFAVKHVLAVGSIFFVVGALLMAAFHFNSILIL